MSQEIETKVLDIDRAAVEAKLGELQAAFLGQVRLSVDWFRPVGVREGEDEWFLRIRSDSKGNHEATWKAKSDISGTTRRHKEINIRLDEADKLADLFLEIGLENYAHQEKDRLSWTYKDWRFDMDMYPGMPAFLEIEGTSEEHVNEAIALLGLQGLRTWAQGERTLVQDVYTLDWYHMKF